VNFHPGSSVRFNGLVRIQYKPAILKPMKPLMPTMIVAIVLALMGGGCSSLEPPAGDRAAWEQQQKEDREAAEKPFTPKDHRVFYGAVYAGLIAACATGHGPVSWPDESAVDP
jgi:hypothetical protein